MGTRSLTHIYDDRTESVLATVYRQMDGYPSGHGEDLAEILKGRTLVNGFGSGTPSKASNGAGCLAATIIAELKVPAGIGGIYLEPPGSEDHGEEYVYSVSPRLEGSIRFKVESIRGGWGNTPRERRLLFEGDVNDFDAAAAEKGSEE